MDRIVERFAAIFFDLNGTFMFGHDRFGAQEDFFATYRSLGANRLTSRDVRDRVLRVCADLIRDYNDPERFDSFPTLLEAVSRYGGLEGQDAQDICDVIAAHEVGRIPAWAATTLQTLSATHPLAVVSNVWAPAEAYDDEFERSGLSGVFRSRIFSSSLRAIKPSPRVFLAALEQMSADPAHSLFVGDSMERDIWPASKLGFSTVLVGSRSANEGADFVVASIAELLRSGESHSRAAEGIKSDPLAGTPDQGSSVAPIK